MSEKQKDYQLEDYKYTQSITTRWHDNDIYGHVNNVVYYAFFDSTVNRYLIDAGLDIHQGKEIAFVVNSNCDYTAPIAYPQNIEVGMAVQRLGNSSVTYQLAIFKFDSSDNNKQPPTLCAQGSFTHVFVDRDTNKSVAIPEKIRSALENLQISN